MHRIIPMLYVSTKQHGRRTEIKEGMTYMFLMPTEEPEHSGAAMKVA